MPERKVSSKTKKKVAASQKWRCNLCKVLLDETFEVDHRIPLWKNGSNATWNLQALCVQCHATKTFHESQNDQPINARVCLACATIYSPYFDHQCS